MWLYLARRLGHGVVVVLAVAATIFLVGRLIGDPAMLMLPVSATEEEIDSLRESMGLNRPLAAQFVDFAQNIVRFDFGTSLWHKVPAIDLPLERLPSTLLLMGATLLVAVPLGVSLGAAAGASPGSLVDRLARSLSIIGVSAVEFWVGLVLILLFAVQLGLVPTSGSGSLIHLVLPACTLALRPMSRLVQLTRESVLKEGRKLYVSTLVAKGVPRRRRIQRHMLRNAAIPIITLSADEVIALMSGAIVVETVFGWPGIGSLLIDSIHRRDLPVIEATVIVIAITVVAVNLLVDLVYTYLDPRLKLEK